MVQPARVAKRRHAENQTDIDKCAVFHRCLERDLPNLAITCVGSFAGNSVLMGAGSTSFRRLRRAKASLNSLEILTLKEGRFELHCCAEEKGKLTSLILPGLEFDLAEVQ